MFFYVIILMSKKIIIYIVSFAILSVVCILSIYFLKNNNKEVSQKPCESVAEDAFLVLDIIKKKDFLNIIKTNTQIQELQNELHFADIAENFAIIDTVEKNISLQENIEKNKNILFAFYRSFDTFEQQIILKIKGNKEKFFFKELYSKLNISKTAKIIKINNTKIIEWQNVKTFYIFVKNSLLIICDSKTLVEKIINTQNEKSKNVLQNENFAESYKSAGKKEIANLYINFEKISSLNQSKNNTAIDFMAKIHNCWQEFDINFSKDILLCNGISYLDNNNNSYFQNILKGNNSDFEIISMIPKSVNSLLFHKYNPDTTVYFEKDLISNIVQETKSEIAVINFENDNLLILDCISLQNSENNILTAVNEKYKQEINIDKLVIDTKNSINYIEMPKKISFSFGNFFSLDELNFCCFYNNYIILSEDSTALKHYFLDIIRNNTLLNDKSYLNFAENLTKNANLFYFSRNGKYQYGYEISKLGNNYYNIFLIDKSAETNSKSVLWQSKISAALIGQIYEIINYENLENEYIFQDEDYNLYLIDDNGVLLWKKSLQEKICSQIFQIDYYNNGQLQYLFSGEKKIFLIDHLGNFVDNYPIILPSEAVAPLTLIKYEDNKTARIAIPCKNLAVYLFDIHGKVLKDWRLPKTELQALLPLKHFVFNKKDYLSVQDNYNVYLYTRQGELISQFFYKEGLSSNEIFASENTGELIFTTSEGQIVKLRIKDKKENKIYLEEYSKNHLFYFRDIDGDKIGEYLFVEGTKIIAYNNSYEKIFAKEMQSEIIKLSFFNSSESDFILAHCVGNQSYILKSDGAIEAYIPKAENTFISLFKEGKKYYYITVSGDKIISKRQL